MSKLKTPCKEISMKKISFTRFKIIGVKILESCKNLQIYLKFDHKSQCRTWIVLLDIRDWWIFHPWKKWFMKISFNWLLYTYLPLFLSYTFFLQIAQISDNYLFSCQVIGSSPYHAVIERTHARIQDIFPGGWDKFSYVIWVILNV